MASHLPIVDCMSRTTVLETVRRKFALLRPLLNERLRRHWAACEALTLERGGVTLVAHATGLSRTTITAGLHELKHPQDDAAAELPPERCRHAGAGRHALEQTDPTLVQDLQTLLEANTRGDPQSPLLWTCKSTRNLAEELQGQGHDFPDEQLGKVIPQGVYDLTRNEGWVSVGIDHDTARFATETIRRWWQEMGRPVYPRAHELLLTVDAGGSNSVRSRLWKVALQELADAIALQIRVCHFPPGTSKWNKIEHRMFCHITKNWRGQPLLSRAIVVQLIGNTKTKAGLHIQAELDCNTYEAGIKVSDEELAAVQLEKEAFHGDWNYTISPK